MKGSYRTPSFEHARVADAMRSGVISCPPDASTDVVARIMATNHVHSVVVSAGGDAPVGVVTDRELLRAASEGGVDRSAASLATDPATAFVDDPLADAARTLVKSDATHLIVVDAAGHPLGVLSALDVAGILAWGLA
jgi:CBS domain-containing protein